MSNKIKNMLSTNNYLEAKKNVGVCNLSYLSKITLAGPDALYLLNQFSTRNLLAIDLDCFASVFVYKKKFICEAFIFKIHKNKIVVISEEIKKLFKLLKRFRKRFPLVTCEVSTKRFYFLTYHGDNALDYCVSKNYYYLNHQGYLYPCLVSERKNLHEVISKDIENNVSVISTDIYNLFLNSNKVLTNLQKINKSIRYDVVSNLYYPDNINKNKKKYVIKHLEASLNFIVPTKVKILSEERKTIGFVHNFYRIANKKNPFFLTIIKKKYEDKMPIIKPYNEEILLREYGGY